MNREINVEALLNPIAGDNPAGENLRYTPVYDEITEARRADDTLDRGDWERELKTSDWDKVITVAVAALTEKSKDLQIAVWLLEALIKKEGFEGCAVGLQIINGLLMTFWDDLYPEIDDDDLDYRVGPLEFANDKISFCLQQVPITDPAVSPGYSLIHWKEGLQVSQANAKTREALVAEGKITSEEFESAVTKTSVLFYEKMTESLTHCLSEFTALDETIDEKFGNEAPRLSEFKGELDELDRHVSKFFKDKGGQVTAPEEAEVSEAESEEDVAEVHEAPEESGEPTGPTQSPPPQGVTQTTVVQTFAPQKVTRLLGSGGKEDFLWKEATTLLKTKGLEEALEMLLGITCSAQSVREKTNCRLLIAKLCLRAGRADLAWPHAEEIFALTSDLSLERWESPAWIANVYGCLYESLTSNEGLGESEKRKAEKLFEKICTTDVTLALKFKS